jgi:hypothetical protein
MLRGVVRSVQESAEAVVAAGAWRRRAEHEESNRHDAFEA